MLRAPRTRAEIKGPGLLGVCAVLALRDGGILPYILLRALVAEESPEQARIIGSIAAKA